MPEYKGPKYNATKTQVLWEEREAIGMTQQQVADYFGKARYDTVAAWETGHSRPTGEGIRTRFILYLLDKLQLRRNPDKLREIWQSVMVEEWRWPELTAEEEDKYLPGASRVVSTRWIASTPSLVPPRPPYRLVGVEKLATNLRERLLRNERVALSGLPGVGKTAIAIHLAHDRQLLDHFRDGILWARVGREVDVLAELSKWGRALKIPTDQAAKLTSMKAWKETLQAAIGRRFLLLVIDDVWNLEVAQSFEVGGPNCSYLATTRIPDVAANFADEGAVEVPELKPEDGYRLLARQAPYVVGKEPETARTLVKAVGALPLALILIGKYLRKESHGKQSRRIQASLDKLQKAEQRLALETPQSPADPNPNLPPGASISLLTIIAISDEALDPAARQALRAVSLLPAKSNTFSEEALVALSATSRAALEKLVDYGLVETPVPDRYSLHQTIADYGKYKLVDKQAYTRLVSYFVHLSETHSTDYQILDLEIGNILTALRTAIDQAMWADMVSGTRALTHYLDVRGAYAIADSLLDDAERITRNIDDVDSLIGILRNRGTVAIHRGDYDRANRYLLEGLELAQRSGNQRETCSLLQNLGVVADNLGKHHEAERLYRAALALANASHDYERVVGLLQNLGVLADDHRDSAKAKQLYQDALVLAKQHGYDLKACALLANLGALAHDEGEYPKASQVLNEGLSIARRIGHLNMISTFLTNLGAVAGETGNHEEERKFYEEALSIATEIRHNERICYIQVNLGGLELDERNYEVAEAHFQAGLTLARKIHLPDRICACLEGLAAVALSSKNYKRAEEYLQEGVPLAHRLRQRKRMSATLNLCGQLHLAQQNLQLARKMFTRAERIARKGNLPEKVAEALFGRAKASYAAGGTALANRLAMESEAIYVAIHHREYTVVQAWRTNLPSDGSIEEPLSNVD